MKNQRKKLASQIGMLLFFLIGLLIMTYPFYINALNNFIDQKRVDIYLKQEKKNFENKKKLLSEENQKNKSQFTPGTDPFNEEKPVDKTEAYFYDHLIGTIDIPKLSVNIPLYDETNNELLNRGATVLDGTSYPVGGKGEHSVISAHRGLPNRELFTNLPELKKGDIFLIHILGETLAYKVRDTKVVLPNQTDSLKKVSDEDLVTLVTCTPYMINSHRLLVTGFRVPYTPEMKKEKESGDKWRLIKQWLIIIGIVMAIILWLILLAHQIYLYRLRQEKMTIKLKILKQHKVVTLSLFNKSGKKQMFRDDKPYEIKVKPNETGEFTNLPSSVYTVKLNNQTLGKVGRKKIKQEVQVFKVIDSWKSYKKENILYFKAVNHQNTNRKSSKEKRRKHRRSNK